MTDNSKQTKSIQAITKTNVGGTVRQISNADLNNQAVDQTSAASVDQQHKADDSFNFNGNRAKGKYGIIALGIIMVVIVVVGLLKLVLSP